MMQNPVYIELFFKVSFKLNNKLLINPIILIFCRQITCYVKSETMTQNHFNFMFLMIN